jgi:hypothetical protein
MVRGDCEKKWKESERMTLRKHRQAADSRSAPTASGSESDASTIHSITMTNRRYGDDEVREIFRLATTGTREPSLPADVDGLTLEELQHIGEEAGI